MAKQAKAETIEVAPQPVATKVAPKPSWEIKDRMYYLTGGKTPLTLTIPGKHTKKHALLYFDEKTGKQVREIKQAELKAYNDGASVGNAGFVDLKGEYANKKE